MRRKYLNEFWKISEKQPANRQIFIIVCAYLNVLCTAYQHSIVSTGGKLFKVVEERLTDFSVQELYDMKSACEFFLIIVCCCLLLYILTAISIVAFVNNRNILSPSRPLCANSTIRPAETGSLEWVVQKQQHFKALVACQ